VTRLLVLAPGRSVTCWSTDEATAILRVATDAGLVADIAPDGRTVRVASLDRAAAPGFVESMLATERARNETLVEDLTREQYARHAAMARAEAAERELRQLKAARVSGSLFDRDGDGDGWSVAS
jgi:hypothetical protein